MEFFPLLAALRRNKLGAVLIALQTAITLGVLCNGIFIIQQRLAESGRPSGADEASVFVIGNQVVGNPPDAAQRIQVDLAALRSTPGVLDAYATNSFPLGDGGWVEGCSLRPEQEHSTTACALYFGDEHALPTLGLKLIAGRNFTAADVVDRNFDQWVSPPVVILTRAVAQAMFPGQSAVGKTVYLESTKHSTTVVGVVERLQIPWSVVTPNLAQYFENSVIEPFRYIAPYYYYVMRVQPAQMSAAMQAARRTLYGIDRNRVLDKMQTLGEARRESYRDDRGLAVILGVVCTALLGVTAFGMVGLTSYWVTQRRRQIGIRRALGATRRHIMRYFQLENLLIAAVAAVIGIALAVGLNLWMVSTFQMARLQWGYLVVGAVTVVVLGQVAVFWPALRAASVPPALATRGA